MLSAFFISLCKGKWFVSTGKDNLLNAWRTPYGASIFQVHNQYRSRLYRQTGGERGRERGERKGEEREGKG